MAHPNAINSTTMFNMQMALSSPFKNIEIALNVLIIYDNLFTRDSPSHTDGGVESYAEKIDGLIKNHVSVYALLLLYLLP